MESKTALKVKFYGDFGSSTHIDTVSFPDVITSMKNGKYLFYKQSLDDKKLVLNVISIDEKFFKNNCNEAGIRCNPDMNTRGLMSFIQEIEKIYV